MILRRLDYEIDTFICHKQSLEKEKHAIRYNYYIKNKEDKPRVIYI
jgi:hypothetical protein